MKHKISLVFFNGTGFISKSIKTLTDSNVSHVGIKLDSDWIFETHIGRNASFVHMAKYDNQEKIEFEVLAKDADFFEKVEDLCDKYQFSRYSAWDIATQAATSWLAPKLRKSLVSFFGGKKFMICSELSARILFEADKSQFAYLSEFEGFTPADLLLICQLNGNDFKLL